MKPRKMVMSMGYSREYYDSEVQAALKEGVARNSPSHVFETFFLLSALAAGHADAATPDGLKRCGHIFLELYLKDRVFFTKLLGAIESYRAKPMNKTVRSLALQYQGLVASSWHDWLKVPDGVLQYQDLARIIKWNLGQPVSESRWEDGPEISTASVKAALSRELKDRARIDSEWEKIFSNWERRTRLGNRKSKKP